MKPVNEYGPQQGAAQATTDTAKDDDDDDFDLFGSDNEDVSDLVRVCVCVCVRACVRSIYSMNVGGSWYMYKFISRMKKLKESSKRD